MNGLELPRLQSGPDAWLGPEMARRKDWILELGRAQLAELEAAAAPHVAAGEVALDALARLDSASFALPSLGPQLSLLREELLHGRGFFLMRGLPVGSYSRLQAAAIFLGVGAHLGRARSQNAKGHILGHVFDLGLSGDDPNVRIYQTSQRQTFHTDSCDVVGLLCLREAKRGGDSQLVSALSIYNVMWRECPDLLSRLLLP